jgi:hypothetical protein
MDPAPVWYAIRIHGHLGPAVVSAFPALASQRHGAHAVPTGLMDQSALYGVLAAGRRPGRGRPDHNHTANHQDPVTAAHRDGR